MTNQRLIAAGSLDLKLNNTTINYTDSDKNLGVIVDKDLNVKEYTNILIINAYASLKKLLAIDTF